MAYENITEEVYKTELKQAFKELDFPFGITEQKSNLKDILIESERFIDSLTEFERKINTLNIKSPLSRSQNPDNQEVEVYAKIAENYIRQGLLLLYKIRERITGEKIIFKTVIEESDVIKEKKRKYSQVNDIHIVEFDIETLFGSDRFISFSGSKDSLDSCLRFQQSAIKEYSLTRDNNNRLSASKPPKGDWEKGTKKLYIKAINKWNERNEGKGTKKKDNFNRGHIFEYMDRLDVLRRASRKEGRGTKTWEPDKDPNKKDGADILVKKLFDNRRKYSISKAFDSISFIKGGDVLNAQLKLLNGTLGSLGGVERVFKGKSAYSFPKTNKKGETYIVHVKEVRGIIPSLKEIVSGKKTDQEIEDILMNLFTKQDEDLGYDIIASATGESIKEINERIKQGIANKEGVFNFEPDTSI